MKLMKRLIIFLLRKKLGVKKYDDFFFTNQKSPNDRYYFIDTGLMKYDSNEKALRKANVSLNWLLDNECAVVVDNSGDWIKELFKKTIL